MTEKKSASELIQEASNYVTFGTLAGTPGEVIPEEKQKAYYNQALGFAKQATETEPKNTRSWLSYMMTLFLHDRHDEAKEAFIEGLKHSDGTIAITAQTSKQLIGFALMLEEIGLVQLGGQFLNAQVQNTPKFAQGWAELVAFYIRHYRNDLLEQVFVKALENCGYADVLESIPNTRSDFMQRSAITAVLNTAKETLSEKNIPVIERTEFRDRTREENRLMVPAFRIDKKTIKQIRKQKKR